MTPQSSLTPVALPTPVAMQMSIGQFSAMRALNDSLTPPQPAPVVRYTPLITAAQPVTKAVTVAVQTQPVLTFATLPAPWGCIAHYESTSNLTAVNYRSGTEGAFQFKPTTWTEFAPAGYPSTPLNASLQQQLTVAEIVLAHRGWGQWETAPLCV
jgi:hypothetical protein